MRFGVFLLLKPSKMFCVRFNESGRGVVWAESVLGVREKDVRVCECEY